MRKFYFIGEIVILFLAFTVCILITMSPSPIIIKIIAGLCFIENVKEANSIAKLHDQAMNRDQEKIEHKEAINEMFN